MCIRCMSRFYYDIREIIEEEEDIQMLLLVYDFNLE